MNKITNASRFLFEELVSRIQERSNAVGIAVAIVDRNGNTQYEKFFGYRDQEKKLPIDEDTIFGLASVTKSFVALSIMQLVEAGKVNLDDPVSKYIPEFTNRNQKPVMVAPDKKTLKKSVKSMFFMVQTRCEVETIKY